MKRSRSLKEKRPLDPEQCVLCCKTEDDRDIYGEKRRHNDVTIHYFCALFSCGLGQSGPKDDVLWGFLEPEIKREVSRARKLRCRFCSEHGASIGCVVKSCRIGFHFPCGLKNGVLSQYFGQFCSYCVDHRPRQKVAPAAMKLLRRASASQPSCAICTLSVDSLVPTDDVLLMPCCQNGLLHRTCIQRQAVYSGLHFFKCPLCNDKDRFQNEMLVYGIYIPDQDAAWELENDAFSDLLERHSCCDVAECKCPDGRLVNMLDSGWEIMLCDYCGSQGTHLTCSNLRTPMDDWVCAFCQVSSSIVDEQRLKAPAVRNSAGETVRKNCHAQPTVPAQMASTDFEHKPRPRRLSRYIQMRAGPSCPGAALIPTGTPRWLQSLLKDDLHTGRNIGSKFAFMCENINGIPVEAGEEIASTSPKIVSSLSPGKEDVFPLTLVSSSSPNKKEVSPTTLAPSSSPCTKEISPPTLTAASSPDKKEVSLSTDKVTLSSSPGKEVFPLEANLTNVTAGSDV